MGYEFVHKVCARALLADDQRAADLWGSVKCRDGGAHVTRISFCPRLPDAASPPGISSRAFCPGPKRVRRAAALPAPKPYRPLMWPWRFER
jgi:hypothetical protein